LMHLPAGTLIGPYASLRVATTSDIVMFKGLRGKRFVGLGCRR